MEDKLQQCFNVLCKSPRYLNVITSGVGTKESRFQLCESNLVQCGLDCRSRESRYISQAIAIRSCVIEKLRFSPRSRIQCDFGEERVEFLIEGNETLTFYSPIHTKCNTYHFLLYQLPEIQINWFESGSMTLVICDFFTRKGVTLKNIKLSIPVGKIEDSEQYYLFKHNREKINDDNNIIPDLMILRKTHNKSIGRFDFDNVVTHLILRYPILDQ